MSRSNLEAEYRVMAHTACEIMWLENIILELGFRQSGLISIHNDNQYAIYIAQNPVFHERTKHIEVDCHLIGDVWTKRVISLPFTSSSKQLADLLIEAAFSHVFSNLCNKLSMINIYAPACGGVLL